MRCIGAHDPPCRRCKRGGLACEFVPRSNAAGLKNRESGSTDTWKLDIEAKLDALTTENQQLRKIIQELSDRVAPAIAMSPATPCGNDIIHHSVIKMVYGLRLDPEANEAWEQEDLSRLCQAFLQHVPQLHFFSGKVTLHPESPLLTVAILFAASCHPNPALAKNRSVYLDTFGRAMSLPRSSFGSSTESHLRDVLGTILVSLLVTGWVEAVGSWINTAYSLLLDSQDELPKNSHWRELWEGVKVIEIENSSLHLLPPKRSRRSPCDVDLPGSPSVSAGREVSILLDIMERRMEPFTGRGLMTVWDAICCRHPDHPSSIDEADLKAIRAWAGDIDAWYITSSQKLLWQSTYVQTIILLNYHLHKVFVLSLGLLSTPNDNMLVELWASSRQALMVAMFGFDAWSSWDLVMLTRAACLLLDAIVAGHGEQNDVEVVQHHFSTLKATGSVAPELRRTLLCRLEKALGQEKACLHSDNQPTESSSTEHGLVSGGNCSWDQLWAVANNSAVNPGLW